MKWVKTLNIDIFKFASKPIFMTDLIELDKLYNKLMDKLKPGSIDTDLYSQLSSVCTIIRRCLDDDDMKIDYTIRQKYQKLNNFIPEKPEVDSKDATVRAETMLEGQSTGIHFSNPYFV